MATIKEQRNLVRVDSGTVTKIAVGFETARPKRLEIEAYAMSKAYEYGLDVPKVREYGTNDAGQEYLIMEKIEGVSVASPELPTPLENVYINLGGRFSIIPPEHNTFGWITSGSHTGNHPTWPSFLIEHVQKYASGLRNRGSIDSPTTDQIVMLVENQTPNISRASLVHRDLKPLNLMLNNSGAVCVLDWECSMLGDPLFDAGVLHSRLYRDERLHKGFTRGILGKIPNKDQCRTVSIYSLVNLVDTLFAYREKASRELFTNLNETVKNLSSRSPNFFALQFPEIRTPKPLPSYLKN